VKFREGSLQVIYGRGIKLDKDNGDELKGKGDTPKTEWDRNTRVNKSRESGKELSFK